jgi:Tol biopolymer transport system component
MRTKPWLFAIALCVIGNLTAQKMASRDAWGNQVPIMEGARLLVGNPPFYLELANPLFKPDDLGEHILLQNEETQPETRDGTSVFPSMSSDAKTIAYARVVSGTPHRLVAITTYSTATGKHADYSRGEYSGSIAISPDASRLAFSASQMREGGLGDNHLHIVDMRNGEQTVGPPVSPRFPVFASWSPDSRRLVYGDTGKIRIWDSDTGTVSTIAVGDLPAWSPSGEWIAYLEPPSEPGRWGSRCVILHPDGSGHRILADTPGGRDFERILVAPPVWSPDSRSVLLNELEDVDRGGVNIWIVDVRTGNQRRALKNTIPVLGWAAAR